MSQFLRSALGVVCPSCDGYNPPLSARCVACGTALQASAAAAGPRSSPPAAPPRQAPSSAPPGGVRPGESVPPGLKPSNRTPAPVAGHAPTPIRTPPARTATPAPGAGPRFGLTVVAGKAKGARYRLPAAGATLGRSRAAILFPEDPYISPHHASLLVRDGALYVRDEASASGVYVSVAVQETLAPGAFFCVGAQLFRYAGPVSTPAPTAGRPIPYGAPLPSGQALSLLEEVLVGGRVGRAVVTGGPLLTIGQLNCDLNFPQDESMAPRHCELSPGPSSATLRDLSGGLGTFVRLPAQGERALRVGDRIRLGLHVIQVEPPA